MPREVIMPALGMAQDEGLIVAWLKSEGEAVEEGDALFEVETDKATMEVEAQGAGYLTNLRAKAGESVPVGDVIALISETAEGEAGSDEAGQEEAGQEPAAEEEEEDAAAEAVSGREIIMPALGMSQDTGRIVAWLVSAGQAVADGDPLFEVETDKATMEVPSDADGYVAAMYAEAGDDVPVGQVIAVISPEKPENPVVGKAPPAAKGEAARDDAKAPDAAPEPESTPAQAPASPGGRILASPKARRLAAERGIDLARLVEAGLSQPFHAADLDRAEAQPAAAAPAPAAGTALSRLHVAARAPAGAYDAFAAWAGRSPLAAMAAGSLRQSAGAGHVLIDLRRPGESPARLSDPDLARPAPDGDGAPALILRDLAATRLTAIEAGAGPVPVLTASRDGGDIVLSLAADPDAMDEAAATGLVAGLADRIADPMRQLF